MYNLAAAKCQTGDFRGALAFFQLLVIVELTNPLYLKGLAGCYHHLDNYAEALSLYIEAYHLEQVQQLECLFYAANCLLKLNDYQQARDFFLKFLNSARKILG